MKELSIEEKSKAYDEALEKARQLCAYPTSKPFISDLQDLFPELKESEDERIRKEIIEVFKSLGEGKIPANLNYADIFTWLEKQGEKTSDKIVERARTEKQRVLVTESDGVANIDWDTRSLQDAKFLMEYGLIYIKKKLEKQGEQKSADKVEPKFKKGDWVVLSTSDGEKVVQIDSIEYFKSGEPRYITSEGRWFGNGTKARLLTDKDVEITTISESKAIVNKIKFWSEEDEETLKDIITSMTNLKDSATSDALRDIYNSKIDWLKSIRPQSTWKPSDEQLCALEHATMYNTLNVNDAANLANVI